MTREPLISVVVPVYNVESYISRCIESIIDQTYTNLDIICVDDGSSDRSGELLDVYARYDSRIRVVHKKNGGVVSARKEAIKIAKGKYLASVDSDDWIEPNMYDEVIRYAIAYDAEIVTTQEIRDYDTYSVRAKSDIDEGLYSDSKAKQLKEQLISTNAFYKCNISGHVCDKLFLTDQYRKIQLRIPDTVTIGEDPLVAYGLLFGASRIYVSNSNYYHYCLRHDSLMARTDSALPARLDEFDRTAKEIFLEGKFNVDNIANQVEALIIYQKLFGDLGNVIKYDGKRLFPYGDINADQKVAVYGAGKFGSRLYSFLKNKGWFNDLQWFDTQGINGAVRVNDSISKLDKILIGAIQADVVEEIKSILRKYGVEDRKVLSLAGAVNHLQK